MKHFTIQKYYLPESMLATFQMEEDRKKLHSTIVHDNFLSHEELELMKQVAMGQNRAVYSSSREELENLKKSMIRELNSRLKRPMSAEGKEYVVELREYLRDSLDTQKSRVLDLNFEKPKKPRKKHNNAEMSHIPQRTNHQNGKNQKTVIYHNLNMRQSGGNGKVQCINCK